MTHYQKIHSFHMNKKNCLKASDEKYTKFYSNNVNKIIFGLQIIQKFAEFERGKKNYNLSRCGEKLKVYMKII